MLIEPFTGADRAEQLAGRHERGQHSDIKWSACPTCNPPLLKRAGCPTCNKAVAKAKGWR